MTIALERVDHLLSPDLVEAHDESTLLSFIDESLFISNKVYSHLPQFEFGYDRQHWKFEAHSIFYNGKLS